MICDQCTNGWIVVDEWPARCAWCSGTQRLSVYRIAQATTIPEHAIWSVLRSRSRQKTSLRVLEVLCNFL